MTRMYFFAGVTFTHWAATDCPAQSVIIYIGSILIPDPMENSHISQPLCQSMLVNNTNGSAIGMRLIATTESNVTCAVCLRPAQSTLFVHYGSSICPRGWDLIYNGVMAVLTDSTAKAPFCATVGGSSSGVSDLQDMLSLSFLTDQHGSELACSLCAM